MTGTRTRGAAATLPPPGLPGLNPRWSRLVTAADTDGVPRTWHVLDNGVEPSAGTVVCVHGNPTWSYLWRRILAQAPRGWRVVAVDHLGMGFSERPVTPRTLAQRIDDLTAVLETLLITGPVVVVAHDWGGPISLGWALAHHERVRGLVLANTAVEQPAGRDAPVLIRLARSRLLRRLACTVTPLFVRVAGLLSRPALPSAVRAALAAPYATADRRRTVEQFVADIPLEPDHVSAATLQRIADGLRDLGGVPVLLQWGPRDPVFSERYLRDLNARLPHADVHLYGQASHLVTEDAPQAATDAWQWILADQRALPGCRARPAGSAGVVGARCAIRRRRVGDRRGRPGGAQDVVRPARAAGAGARSRPCRRRSAVRTAGGAPDPAGGGPDRCGVCVLAGRCGGGGGRRRARRGRDRASSAQRASGARDRRSPWTRAGRGTAGARPPCRGRPDRSRRRPTARRPAPAGRPRPTRRRPCGATRPVR